MSDFYYLNTEQQAVGPMSLEGIRKLVDAGIIDAGVLVCPAGEQEWKPLPERNEDATASVGPPRVPPPPRSHPSEPAVRPTASSAVPPDWFPLASMIAGITAVLALFSSIPLLGILLAVPALTLGILAIRQSVIGNKPFAVTGITTSSLALMVSIGFFLLGSIGGSVGNPEAAAIEKALEEDQAIYREAKSRFPNNAAQATRHIAERMQRIDITRCPPEFRLAFQQHVNAWAQAAPYIQADTPLSAFFEGLYAGATDDYRLLGLSNHQANVAKEQIGATYRVVLNVAAAYGARIPDS